MPFPTTNATVELPAINQILTSCGQAPVTTLDQTNPDVAIAYDTLLQVSREVQAEGWTFNKEFHYSETLQPNAADEIELPNNVLQVSLTRKSSNNNYDAVKRGGKLYDREHHTFKWTDISKPIEFDVVWEYDWVDLPQPIQDFVTARAATLVSQRIVGDPQQYRMLQQQEAYARAMALEYDANQGNYNFFDHPQSNLRNYQGYQPYHVLQR